MKKIRVILSRNYEYDLENLTKGNPIIADIVDLAIAKAIEDIQGDFLLQDHGGFWKIEASEIGPALKPAGKCPECGSGNIDYAPIEYLDGQQVYYPVECRECELSFNEWYNLEFVGLFDPSNGKEYREEKEK